MSESCNFRNQGFRASSRRLPCSFALAGSLFLFGLIFGSSFGACPGFAAEALTSNESTNLGKIENKLFSHPYDKEETEDRLARIEKAVYGETKPGTAGSRISALLQTVPNLEQPAPPAKTATSSERPNTSQSTTPSSPTSKRSKHRLEDDAKTTFKDNGSDTADGDIGSYPTVSAMEKRLLGKEYASDPIGQRLDRLETKIDGRPSTLTDLSDRVDHLKSKTGIDVARRPPVGSDWNDDEEASGMGMGMGMPTKRGRSTDDYSLGPRDLNLPGTPPTFAGGGGGRYGFGTGGGAYPRQAGSSNATSSTLGVSQQITALEMEIFGKIYAKDSLQVRLSRLEKDVFPGQKTFDDQDVPKRVQRLVAAFPLNGGQNSVARRSSDDDLADDLNALNGGPQAKGGGGLGKIISSISNYLSGGGSVGGFPTTGTYVTDPQTGMMIDQVSGNIIDPSTGTVIGNRGSNAGGLGNYGSYGSFNNGFSPFGTPMGGNYNPYGGGSGGYGTGSGMHFGFGGGRMGGGMWP
jgi:hypothetical protein